MSSFNFWTCKPASVLTQYDSLPNVYVKEVHNHRHIKRIEIISAFIDDIYKIAVGLDGVTLSDLSWVRDRMYLVECISSENLWLRYDDTVFSIQKMMRHEYPDDKV